VHVSKQLTMVASIFSIGVDILAWLEEDGCSVWQYGVCTAVSHVLHHHECVSIPVSSHPYSHNELSSL